MSSPATASPERMPRPEPPTRPAPAVAARPPFVRPRECVVAGVSAGIAAHLGAPVWAVRALFVVLSLLGGAGVLLYAWCWVFVPWEPGAQAPARRAPIAWILIAAAAAGLVIEISARGQYAWDPTLDSRLIGGLALAVVCSAAAGLWAGIVDRVDPARGPRHALWVRLAALTILVVLFVTNVEAGGNTLDLLLGALLPLLAVAVVLSPGIIVTLRELSGERIARIKEEQRAEMAAHLHDSVLQTLALIQNRAGASSEVARLARAQERELRAWLYDGDAPADSDLATDLRDYAGALELDYAVRIEVVSAGASTERASGELAAAAREAMLNAARHAGGEISVYIEGTTDAAEVFVRDRGTGFVLDAVPSDRLGVRESIIGRMRRAGGAAHIRPGAGGGTEVHLRFARIEARHG